MRKLCPNVENEEGLETVLEVPIPEEMFGSSNKNNNSSSNNKTWQNVKALWTRTSQTQSNDKWLLTSNGSSSNNSTEIQLLLGVVAAPLVPLPISCDHDDDDDDQFLVFDQSVKDHPMESSMAKYIVHQYIASVGGERALNSIESMYAMGKVRMTASDFNTASSEDTLLLLNNKNKTLKSKNIRNRSSSCYNNGNEEVGGFVIWQKRPDLWSLELVLSGFKIISGSDGNVAWRQTPWHHSHASRGPSRPLRRLLQGLDPRSTARLFSNSVCIGEETINEKEDCFVLKLEAEPSTLRARSSSNVEIIRHTMWGYFSQKTGLLVQLEDSQLVKIKGMGNESVLWETKMESEIENYRTIDGMINIAHSGSTSVSLLRYGESTESPCSMTRMEEAWTIEEVDFNIKGLSMDCFLPPSDLTKENITDRSCHKVVKCTKNNENAKSDFKIWLGSSRISVSKVVAIDDASSVNFEENNENKMF